MKFLTPFYFFFFLLSCLFWYCCLANQIISDLVLVIINTNKIYWSTATDVAQWGKFHLCVHKLIAVLLLKPSNNSAEVKPLSILQGVYVLKLRSYNMRNRQQKKICYRKKKNSFINANINVSGTCVVTAPTKLRMINL